MLKRTQDDEIAPKENKEKLFEPETLRLGKVTKKNRQSGEYLSKKNWN